MEGGNTEDEMEKNMAVVVAKGKEVRKSKRMQVSTGRANKESFLCRLPTLLHGKAAAFPLQIFIQKAFKLAKQAFQLYAPLLQQEIYITA